MISVSAGLFRIKLSKWRSGRELANSRAALDWLGMATVTPAGLPAPACGTTRRATDRCQLNPLESTKELSCREIHEVIRLQPKGDDRIVGKRFEHDLAGRFQKLFHPLFDGTRHGLAVLGH